MRREVEMKGSRRGRSVAVAAAGFAAAFLVTFSAEAERVSAYYHQYSMHLCMPSSSAAGYATVGTGRAVSPASGTTLNLLCPFIATTDMPLADVDYITVAGLDNSSESFSAQACVTYWDSAGGECGTLMTTSGAPGSTWLTLDRTGTNELSSWVVANQYDYPFLNVTVGTGLQLYGIYLDTL